MAANLNQVKSSAGMLRMNEESEKGCFEPGEIKENTKEMEIEEVNVEEGNKLGSSEEKYLNVTEEQVSKMSEAEHDAYWTHGLSEEDKKKGKFNLNLKPTYDR